MDLRWKNVAFNKAPPTLSLSYTLVITAVLAFLATPHEQKYSASLSFAWHHH